MFRRAGLIAVLGCALLATGSFRPARSEPSQVTRVVGQSLVRSTPIISGPSQVRIGELIVLRAAVNDAEPVWTILDSQGREGVEVELDEPVGDMLTPIRYVVIDGDTPALVFSSPSSGRFFVTLIGVSVDADGAIEKTVARHVVTIGDGTPTPNPDNPPEPEPQLEGIAKTAHDLVDDVVPGDSRKHHKKTAAAFRNVSSMIAAGAIKTADDVIAETATQTKAQLSSAHEDWRAWGNAIGDELNTLASAGKLKTMAQYSATYLEIADGLEAWSE